MKSYIHASVSSTSAYLWVFFEVVGVLIFKKKKKETELFYELF